MIFVHNINPVAINILNFNVYWYSLAYILAFIIGGIYAKRILSNVNISFKGFHVDEFLSYSIIGVIIGGRVGYVIFYNFDYYIQNVLEIFKIWQGGMSFHGGLIGMIISMILFSKKNQIYFFDISNIVACCSPIGLFLGRIANFINGELYGIPTNGQWGVIFNKIDQLPRHPSQLYEAFFEGLLLFLLLLYFLKKNKFNTINCSSIFLVFYGISRFFIEFFRLPDPQIGYIFNYFSTGQLLCLPMIVLGLLIYKK